MSPEYRRHSSPERCRAIPTREAQTGTGEHGERRERRRGRERHRLRDRVRFVRLRGCIPAPTWVWLVVLAVGVLLAVKDGISGLDVVTLGLAGFMIVGSLMSLASTATTDAPDLTLKEPIPVPAGYDFRLDGLHRDFARTYRSKPIPAKTANQAVQEVVD